MNLVAACGIAFGAVFVLLTTLAILMQAITAVFRPPSPPTTDVVVTTAITSTVASLMQGARVTRIEETP